MPKAAVVAISVWVVTAATVAALAAIHVVATGGTWTLPSHRLAELGITPATTLTHVWRHLWAGLFHTNVGHIAFNVALFAVAFPLAARNHGTIATLVGGYALAPATVFLLHVALVLPLAQAGFPYAVQALDRPLVGFSVAAYAMLGMAVVQMPVPIAWGVVGAVIAFELGGGLVLQLTGPFIFVYHLAGFGMGALMRGAFAQPE